MDKMQIQDGHKGPQNGCVCAAKSDYIVLATCNFSQILTLFI